MVMLIVLFVLWNKKNARDGLLKKARERQDGYKKPGVRRREKKDAGIKNTRRRERNNY